MRQCWIAMAAVVFAAILWSAVGCDTLGNVLQLDKTTVRLVNSSSAFSVHVELYYGDDQNVLEAVLTSLGTKREFTLAPGASESFSLDCTELQAIIIDKADLDLGLGNIGPEQRTRVYRDGTDFHCGHTLVFTFTHPTIPTRLDIGFEEQ